MSSSSSLLILCLSLFLVILSVHAGPYGVRTSNSYGNYRYQYPTAYNRNYYQNNYYQGYRSPYQYQRQGYGNNYQNYYQNGYNGYQNGYQNYNYNQNAYARPQPSLFPGLNYDGHGNSYIGTKENGIYIFCNGRGCPGRG